MPSKRERRPCGICGRVTARIPRTGRRHYPHKCPHGIWCVRGTVLLGMHANHVPIAGPNRCARCATDGPAARRDKEERCHTS